MFVAVREVLCTSVMLLGLVEHPVVEIAVRYPVFGVVEKPALLGGFEHNLEFHARLGGLADLQKVICLAVNSVVVRGREDGRDDNHQ